MKCDICKINEAEIHIEQRAGENSQSLHICKVCAEEKGIDQKNPGIDNVLTGIFTQLLKDKLEYTKKFEESLICPVCRTNLKNVREKKKVGCSTCYIFFDKQLDTFDIDFIQYDGRIPQKFDIYRDYLIELPSLKEDLEEALENESFEEAEEIRKKIERF